MASQQAAPTILAYRDSTGISVLSGSPSYAPIATPANLGASPRSFLYSPLGKYLVLVFADRLVLSKVTIEAVTVVHELPITNALEIEFSPKETYISTFIRYNPSANSATPAHRNVSVWNVETGKEVFAYTQKNASDWNVKWTEDESYCGILVGNEVQFYESKSFSNGIASRLKLDCIKLFSMSPGRRPTVAIFYPEKNGSPGSVKLYDITNLQTPLSSKSFFRADSVNFYWNSLGTNVLVFTHTDVDVTGKSYYGETSLYYLSITGNFDCKVTLDKPGPVHDVCWAPNAKEFVVVYGTMPAKATLFDHRANPMYEFGNAARNQVKFNSHGRFLFIGGFGNLAGDMDIWDRRSFKKMCTIKASNSSSCDWAPDGKHIMTSTLYKRLKVDNGIKIWHYTGALVHQVQVKEMHQTSWMPASRDLWPDRASLSPPPPSIASCAPAVSEGKYRPPGARNTASSTNFYDRDAIDRGVVSTRGKRVPGAYIPGATPEHERKNKTVQNGTTDSPAPITSGVIPGSNVEAEKRIKLISKKLKQIEDLKQKKDTGVTLELTQIQKIESEESLRAEMEKLTLSIA
ncbi:hypothetical protein BATDEDRAFT_18651 [Batrachochytrium dendrobatidis JAM81]|uniref:Eukaryotic translation initiation factor 2A n=1 Tax=Batrachochytrium dendrobatidis (strain JAM81 / FGSC 10211) TaxID=684364 RepID=F4NTY3_BATDJ|nr:uncharacterized protein BATDEDRAFT_18651 [Batrachochytrium dendrobatidis JAM81]EGF84373.1 hypothetical protein BATDEDRAFT_18651 [Batrachochytrium dendrobatidis JAM81]KAJ8327237.1 hypothetical protein O5D80_004644 [Batrachochytrium dendrobatidis]KAK5667861.1 hypothetical protein QVD99_004910 [Batrachochytrium dendrobatidis]|eukprot:XP_006675197.1 hypothetical protein BATDEDRAFT_18651 [Batrachochytrium dendrobatidis JAM81]